MAHGLPVRAVLQKRLWLPAGRCRGGWLAFLLLERT